MTENKCRSMIVYRREYFTAQERAQLATTKSYAVIRDILLTASVRSLVIPARLLQCETSYSSFRRY